MSVSPDQSRAELVRKPAAAAGSGLELDLCEHVQEEHNILFPSALDARA